MLGSILSFLGSGVVGSVVGVIGNWLNQRAIRQTKQMEMDHEATMARIQIEVLTAKTDAAIKVTQAKVQGAVDLEESKAYTTNIVVANQTSFSDKWLDKLLEAQGWVRFFAYPFAAFLMTGFGFIEVFKGFMRPALTTAFTAGFGVITWMSWQILQQHGLQGITPAEAIIYFTMAVDTCFMLTTTCVTWWFADRRMAKALARMHEKRMEQRDEVSEGQPR